MKMGMLAAAGMVMMLAGCSAAPRPVAGAEEGPIRDSARQFAAALRAGDAAKMRDLGVAESDAQTLALSQTVLADAMESRRMQLALGRHFGEMEKDAAICGTDAWAGQWEKTAATGAIMQAGNRVRIGEAGSEGTLFLRQVGGRWKVELVPTLLAETGGRKELDAAAHYRVGVGLAVNAYMMGRLERGEFATMADYQTAQRGFWLAYMACLANGEDPREKLLNTLPPVPAVEEMVAEDR